MTPKFDEGTIVGTVLLGVAPSGPDVYRRLGEIALYGLFRVLAPFMADGTTSLNGMKWASVKRARRDLLTACDFRGLAEDEIIRRRAAFAGFEVHFVE